MLNKKLLKFEKLINNKISVNFRIKILEVIFLHILILNNNNFYENF
jgi:hypothetical protein